MDLAVTHGFWYDDCILFWSIRRNVNINTCCESHILVLLLVMNNVNIDCDILHCHFQKKIFIILSFTVLKNTEERVHIAVSRCVWDSMCP